MRSKSLIRQRVVDHGEVFTPQHLVNDMLDLPGVAEECTRIDARFLEPACGDGNFLAEVLHRRLIAIDQRHKSAQLPWERDALYGLACIYGIELLYDNVQACRDRLLELFTTAYTKRFRAKAKPAAIDAARYIVRANIHLGDALKMTTTGKHAQETPIRFIEWGMLTGGRFKRHVFEYRELVGDPPGAKPALFAADIEPLFSDTGKRVFITQPIDDLPIVHYLKLGEEPEPWSVYT